MRQEAKNREEELSGKLSKLTEEYEKLKSNMVSTFLFCAVEFEYSEYYETIGIADFTHDMSDIRNVMAKHNQYDG